MGRQRASRGVGSGRGEGARRALLLQLCPGAELCRAIVQPLHARTRPAVQGDWDVAAEGSCPSCAPLARRQAQG